MTTPIPAEPVPLEMRDDVLYVEGTRIPLDTVITAFLQGETAEQVVQQFPTLDLASVYGIFSYYLRHRDEIDEYLIERRRISASVRAENERRFDPAGKRRRLLARKQRRAR